MVLLVLLGKLGNADDCEDPERHNNNVLNIAGWKSREGGAISPRKQFHLDYQKKHSDNRRNLDILILKTFCLCD